MASVSGRHSKSTLLTNVLILGVLFIMLPGQGLTGQFGFALKQGSSLRPALANDLSGAIHPGHQAFPATSAGSVAYTLVMENRTVIPGNFLPGNAVGPYGMATDPLNGYIYVVGEQTDNVAVIDGATNTVIGAIGVGPEPEWVTFDSANGYLYVADYGSNKLTVINGSTNGVIGTVTVGQGPDNIAYDSANGYLYVTNFIADTVTVVNGSTDTPVGTVPVGDYPQAIGCDSASGYCYAANSYSNNVTVINATTNSFAGSINVGGSPWGVTYDSANGHVYVADRGTNNLTVINGVTNAVVGSITVHMQPNAIAFDNANNLLYVADSGANDVTVINGTTDAVAGYISADHGPWDISYDSTDRCLYVPNMFTNDMTVISGSTDKVVDTFVFGSSTYALAYDSANGYLYVSNWFPNDVAVINSTTDAVVDVIPISGYMYSMAYDSANGYIYVTNSADVTIINGATNSIVKSINQPMSMQPVALVYDNANREVYSVNTVADNVSVINGTTNKVVGSIPVGGNPRAAAYDSANGYLYVANMGSSNVTVINTTTNEGVGSIQAGPGLQQDGVTFDSSNRYVYVANWGTDNVSVINGTTDTIVGSVPVGLTPDSVAYDNATGYVYVANANCGAGSCTTQGSITVINGTDDSIAGTLPVGSGPETIIFDNTSSDLYVANLYSGSVSVISTSPSSLSLLSVAIRPSSSTVTEGGTQSFAATPICTGPCSAGTTYSWSITNAAMGSLSATSGSPVSFTAGCTAGTVGLFVNATLNGITKPSSAAIITIKTWIASISSVAVSPTSPTVNPTDTQGFVTSVTYSGSCPSGPATYSWALTNSAMGSLNSTTTSTVTFTAGTMAGTVGLFVNATANGITVGNSAEITVTDSLISLAVTPKAPSVDSGAKQAFLATPTCSATCPSGITYSWKLTNSTMGTITGTGASVNFTAGGTSGTVGLFVNATLNGLTAHASTEVTIIAPISTLTSVAVLPAIAVVLLTRTQNFSASPTCTATCPGAITYEWNLTNVTMGTMSGTGSSVVFTANFFALTGRIFVNATLNGITRESSAMIIVTFLGSVSLSPAAPTVSSGGMQNFTATPWCIVSCPSSFVAYEWNLTNSAMGSLNSSTGSLVTFSAGIKDGTVGLFVNATLDTIVHESFAEITITSLTSVAVNPTTSTVPVGEVQTFTASPTCIVTCPQTGIMYSWNLTHSALGSVSPINGSLVTFTAGSTTGTVGLFVNATLNGITYEGSAVITITAAPSAVLTSVALSPTAPTVVPGGTQVFTATPTCSIECPSSGITYSWHLSNPSLGRLNGAGASVTFTAGATALTGDLDVNATLGNTTVTNSALITIVVQSAVTLSDVVLSNYSVDLSAGGTHLFSATPECTGSGGSSAICPSGITYAWSKNNDDGNFTAPTGASTTFIAGNSGGVLTLTVTATLDGVSKNASALIFITAAPVTKSSSTSTTILLGVILAVVAAILVIVVLLLRRRGKEETPSEDSGPSAPGEATPEKEPAQEDTAKDDSAKDAPAEEEPVGLAPEPEETEISPSKEEP
jgi:YVTN family beta-propeller protein